MRAIYDEMFIIKLLVIGSSIPVTETYACRLPSHIHECILDICERIGNGEFEESKEQVAAFKHFCEKQWSEATSSVLYDLAFGNYDFEICYFSDNRQYIVSCTKLLLDNNRLHSVVTQLHEPRAENRRIWRVNSCGDLISCDGDSWRR